MARLIALLFAFAALAACGQSGEKLCAEAVIVEIAADGGVSVNRKQTPVEEIDAELALLHEACGAKLRVFLSGYGEADKAATERIVAVLEGSAHVGELQIAARGDEPAK